MYVKALCNLENGGCEHLNVITLENHPEEGLAC